MTLPWPPISSEAPSEPSVGAAAGTQELPELEFPHALVHDLARRHQVQTVAAQAHRLGFGQLRALPAQPTAPIVSMLLLREVSGAAGHACWDGLLVTPDIDYAGPQDWIIQAEDGVSDPACAVVFTRESLTCWLRADAPFLGVLRAEAVAGMLALADRQIAADPANADFLAIQALRPVTGRRTSNDALRREYLEQARLAPAPATAPVQPQPDKPVRPGWRTGWWAAGALASLWGLSVLVPLLFGPAADTGYRGQSARRPVIAVPMQTVPALTVILGPETTQREFTEALRAINGTVVGGPGEQNEYTVALRSTPVETALAVLRQRQGIDTAVERPGGARVTP